MSAQPDGPRRRPAVAMSDQRHRLGVAAVDAEDEAHCSGCHAGPATSGRGRRCAKSTGVPLSTSRSIHSSGSEPERRRCRSSSPTRGWRHTTFFRMSPPWTNSSPIQDRGVSRPVAGRRLEPQVRRDSCPEAQGGTPSRSSAATRPRPRFGSVRARHQSTASSRITTRLDGARVVRPRSRQGRRPQAWVAVHVGEHERVDVADRHAQLGERRFEQLGAGQVGVVDARAGVDHHRGFRPSAAAAPWPAR